ncbi:hypothetical protein [Halalkalibacter wakoensis]|nr:hypothetical protein [Halalkalibacter wakoensis]
MQSTTVSDISGLGGQVRSIPNDAVLYIICNRETYEQVKLTTAAR